MPDDEYIANTTLPECNRDATNVNDVYSIYDIVPESKLETLYNNVTQILNDHPSSLEKYVHCETTLKLLSMSSILSIINVLHINYTYIVFLEVQNSLATH